MKRPIITCLILAFLCTSIGVCSVGAECTDCEEVTACPTCLCPFGDYSCYFDGGISLEAGAGILIPGFNAYPIQGQAPLLVSFQDTTVGGATEWSWAFGDGATSTEQNPIHTYTSPGSYSVVLKVSKVFFDVNTGEMLGFAKLSKTVARSNFIIVTEDSGLEEELVNPNISDDDQESSSSDQQNMAEITDSVLVEEKSVNPSFLVPEWVKSSSDQQSLNSGQNSLAEQGDFFYNMVGYGFSSVCRFLL